MGSNSGWDVDWNRPPTTDEDTGGTTTPPPVNTDPTWYTPTNVLLPPGVDPYYGVSITGINDSSSGGTTPPIDQDGTGGSKSGDQLFSNGLFSSPLTDQERQEYNLYVMQGGNESETGWWALKHSMDGASNSNSGSGMSSGSRDFRIARPNMTWNNSLPSVIPSNGQAAATAYGPSPFTIGANTPGVVYTKPPLTYNNPYNTNPYLPTANPFALVPNNASGA